jgi:hypothetical protein
MRCAYQRHCPVGYLALIIRLTYIRGSPDSETYELLQDRSEVQYSDPNGANTRDLLQDYKRRIKKCDDFCVAF